MSKVKSEFEKRFPKGEIYSMHLQAEDIRQLKREGWLEALKWVLTDNKNGYDELDEWDRETGMRCLYIDDIQQEIEALENGK